MPKINLKRSSDNKKLKSNRLKCTLPVKKTLNKSPTNVVDIGFNIKRWISTKLKLSFENDCDFINYLLDLAEKQLSRRSDQDEVPNETRPDADEEDAQKQISSNNLASRGLARKKISKKTSEVKNVVQKRTNKTLAVKNSVKCMPKLLMEKLDAVVQNSGGLKSKDQVRNGSKTLDTRKVEGSKLLSCSNVLENKTLETILKIKRKNKHGGNKVIPNKKRVKFSTDNENVLKVINKNKVRNIKKHKNEENKVKNRRRIKNHDIRKAPQHSKVIQTPPTVCDTVVCVQQLELETADLKPTEDENSADQKDDIKVKVCHSCNTRHMQDECPLTKSSIIVSDSISLEKWHLGNQEHTNSDNVFTIENGCYNYKLTENIDDATDNNQNIDEIDVKFQTVVTFSETSLPSILQLQDIAPNHGLSVVVKSQVAKYTRFGPLIARSIKETDIADDCTMRDVWEIYDGTDRLYFSTENPNESNWLRYVRPSQSREERNVTVVLENKCVFLVSTKVIAAGEEMLYWIDECNSLWGKKKLEKSSCGGCNLKFAHALYYRTHCSVFHDPAFSLTIRKYHCKVCGAAVLGKENIMRHAAEMHDGRGAYQCQYCDKFFLRLNYLEMHRTYGCSSNPQRARPLCDFCGRKFCQPQKLKVHIKRMHSDMAEVLRDFQCKLCSKLLGSRAALQRHSKEVHSKDVGAVSSCPRCGKVFQNKSNLKIHMLTHSGVKPFRCCESSCNAAFTTKQCLQFHYKKVHGYTPDMMPRIERSVAYTFDAYSGGREEYELEMQARRARNSIDHMNKSNRRDILLLNNSDSESLPDLDESHQEEPNGNPITISDSSPNPQTPPMLEPFVDEKIGDNKNHINADVYGHLVFKKNFNKEMSSASQSLISKGSKKWLGETESPLGDDPDKIRTEDPESSQDILHYNESDILQENLYPFNPSQKLDSNSGITMEGDGRPRSMDMIEQTRSANPDALTHMYNRVSSSASMLVEAALDSVTHIDLSKPEHDSEGVIIVDQIENGLTENNMLLSSEHIDIDSMDGYNLSQDNAMHGSLEDIKIKHVDLISRNNSPNDYSIQLDSDSIGINKHEIDLSDMDHLQDQNILDIHGRTIDITSPTLIHESEIDVGSLDSSSLHRSVENYTSLHQEEFASPRPTPDLSRSIGHGQEYTIHHGSEMSSPNERVRLHYSLPHDNDLNESPAVTPVPRYDFSHQLPTDLSSDEEGMVQNLSLNLKEKSEQLDLSNNYTKQYDANIDALELRTKYEAMDAADFRNDRNFEPLILSGELQGLDMTSRGYHHNFQMATSTNLNRYHHIYDIAERQTVDLSLTRTSGYVSPPPYSHSDVLRVGVVSLDLTPGGRHSVDLGLPRVTHHSHSSFTSQIQNSRLISDQSGRLIEHRLLSTEHRLLASEHSLSTNRLISDPGHLLLEQSLHPARLLSPEPHSRLLDQSRLMSDSRILQSTPSGPSDLQSSRSLVSPRGFASYSAPSGTFLPVRAGNLSSPSHMSDPSAVYHPYSGYY